MVVRGMVVVVRRRRIPATAVPVAHPNNPVRFVYSVSIAPTPDNQPPQPVQTPAYSGIKRCYDLMTPEVRQTLDAIEVETLAEKRVAAQMGYDAARSKMEAADRTLALQVVAADDMMTFSNKYDAAIDETRKRRIEHQLNETPLSGSAETAGNALLPDLTPRKLLG